MMKAISIAFLAFLAPASAFAVDPDPSRFQLERSGDHFVRLDRQTGAMTICEDKGGNLVCRMAADERAAYDDELNRLGDRVKALEERAAVTPRLPTDAEVDRSLGIMERWMRSFMGMVREFQGEEEKDKTLPQKTRALYE